MDTQNEMIAIGMNSGYPSIRGYYTRVDDSGSIGGGVDNYEHLKRKPQIDGTVLNGSMIGVDLIQFNSQPLKVTLNKIKPAFSGNFLTISTALAATDEGQIVFSPTSDSAQQQYGIRIGSEIRSLTRGLIYDGGVPNKTTTLSSEKITSLLLDKSDKDENTILYLSQNNLTQNTSSFVPEDQKFTNKEYLTKLSSKDFTIRKGTLIQLFLRLSNVDVTNIIIKLKTSTDVVIGSMSEIDFQPGTSRHVTFNILTEEDHTIPSSQKMIIEIDSSKEITVRTGDKQTPSYVSFRVQHGVSEVVQQIQFNIGQRSTWDYTKAIPKGYVALSGQQPGTDSFLEMQAEHPKLFVYRPSYLNGLPDTRAYDTKNSQYKDNGQRLDPNGYMVCEALCKFAIAETVVTITFDPPFIIAPITNVLEFQNGHTFTAVATTSTLTITSDTPVTEEQTVIVSCIGQHSDVPNFDTVDIIYTGGLSNIPVVVKTSRSVLSESNVGELVYYVGNSSDPSLHVVDNSFIPNTVSTAWYAFCTTQGYTDLIETVDSVVGARLPKKDDPRFGIISASKLIPYIRIQNTLNTGGTGGTGSYPELEFLPTLDGEVFNGDMVSEEIIKSSYKTTEKKTLKEIHKDILTDKDESIKSLKEEMVTKLHLDLMKNALSSASTPIGGEEYEAGRFITYNNLLYISTKINIWDSTLTGWKPFTYTTDQIELLITNAIQGIVQHNMVRGVYQTHTELPLVDNAIGQLAIIKSNKSEYIWVANTPTGTIEDWELLGTMDNNITFNTEFIGQVMFFYNSSPPSSDWKAFTGESLSNIFYPEWESFAKRYAPDLIESPTHTRLPLANDGRFIRGLGFPDESVGAKKSYAIENITNLELKDGSDGSLEPRPQYITMGLYIKVKNEVTSMNNFVAMPVLHRQYNAGNVIVHNLKFYATKELVKWTGDITDKWIDISQGVISYNDVIDKPVVDGTEWTGVIDAGTTVKALYRPDTELAKRTKTSTKRTLNNIFEQIANDIDKVQTDLEQSIDGKINNSMFIPVEDKLYVVGDIIFFEDKWFRCTTNNKWIATNKNKLDKWIATSYTIEEINTLLQSGVDSPEWNISTGIQTKYTPVSYASTTTTSVYVLTNGNVVRTMIGYRFEELNINMFVYGLFVHMDQIFAVGISTTMPGNMVIYNIDTATIVQDIVIPAGMNLTTLSGVASNGTILTIIAAQSDATGIAIWTNMFSVDSIWTKHAFPTAQPNSIRLMMYANKYQMLLNNNTTFSIMTSSDGSNWVEVVISGIENIPNNFSETAGIVYTAQKTKNASSIDIYNTADFGIWTIIETIDNPLMYDGLIVSEFYYSSDWKIVVVSKDSTKEISHIMYWDAIYDWQTFDVVSLGNIPNASLGFIERSYFILSSSLVAIYLDPEPAITHNLLKINGNETEILNTDDTITSTYDNTTKTTLLSVKGGVTPPITKSENVIAYVSETEVGTVFDWVEPKTPVVKSKSKRNSSKSVTIIPEESSPMIINGTSTDLGYILPINTPIDPSIAEYEIFLGKGVEFTAADIDSPGAMPNITMMGILLDDLGQPTNMLQLSYTLVNGLILTDIDGAVVGIYDLSTNILKFNSAETNKFRNCAPNMMSMYQHYKIPAAQRKCTTALSLDVLNGVSSTSINIDFLSNISTLKGNKGTFECFVSEMTDYGVTILHSKIIDDKLYVDDKHTHTINYDTSQFVTVDGLPSTLSYVTIPEYYNGNDVVIPPVEEKIEDKIKLDGISKLDKTDKPYYNDGFNSLLELGGIVDPTNPNIITTPKIHVASGFREETTSFGTSKVYDNGVYEFDTIGEGFPTLTIVEVPIPFTAIPNIYSRTISGIPSVREQAVMKPEAVFIQTLYNTADNFDKFQISFNGATGIKLAFTASGYWKAFSGSFRYMKIANINALRNKVAAFREFNVPYYFGNVVLSDDGTSYKCLVESTTIISNADLSNKTIWAISSGSGELPKGTLSNIIVGETYYPKDWAFINGVQNKCLVEHKWDGIGAEGYWEVFEGVSVATNISAKPPLQFGQYWPNKTRLELLTGMGVDDITTGQDVRDLITTFGSKKISTYDNYAHMINMQHNVDDKWFVEVGKDPLVDPELYYKIAKDRFINLSKSGDGGGGGGGTLPPTTPTKEDAYELIIPLNGGNQGGSNSQITGYVLIKENELLLDIELSNMEVGQNSASIFIENFGNTLPELYKKLLKNHASSPYFKCVAFDSAENIKRSDVSLGLGANHVSINFNSLPYNGTEWDRIFINTVVVLSTISEV